MIQELQDESKHYRIGYVPGVFDLFHVGHLNLIRRSKKKCDYLIVGVLTDELVRLYKGKNPVIPLQERIEIVRAIRYVDEVVIVDYHNTDKLVAQELYQYDCHFSGDDHAGEWYETQRALRERGSDMYFFGYTPGISSTMIKEGLSNTK